MIDLVDPTSFMRGLMTDLAPGTAIENIEIRANAREDGDVPPFIVLAEAGDLHHRTLPLFQPARVSLTAWALTEGGAALMYRTASALLHRFGPVIRDGVGLFRIFDETGLQQPFEDPDTGWWRGFGVFDLDMVDRVLA